MKSLLSSDTLAYLQSLCARFAEDKPSAHSQITRAYDLVVEGGLWPCPFFADDGGMVALSSDGVTEYQVGPNFCECRAGETGHLCYHRIARSLWLKAQKEEKRQARVAAAAKASPDRKGTFAVYKPEPNDLSRHTAKLHQKNAKAVEALHLADVLPFRQRR